MQALFGALAASLIVAGTAQASPASPAAQLKGAIAAGDRQTSVHYVSQASSPALEITMVGDAGRTAGIQRITYTKGGKTGHVTVVVVAGKAYVHGDAFTLENYMGFSARNAASSAGQWLVLRPGDSGYASVSAGVRLVSTLSELQLPNPLTALRSRVAGQAVVGLRTTHAVAGRKATYTLYVRAAGSPLPVEEVAGNGRDLFRVTFSRWNERVDVTAPTTGNTA